ncbi:DUF86 domain-containing protein [Hyphomicrobium sp. DY-1]|uniref:HepT-like ribonuclease domain-containing protein n=1 Tax=Hyphomicrobium sp. DY-1 TaxID=3075650 RepID=UPI0039C153D1
MRNAIKASAALVKGMSRERLESNEAVYWAAQNRILVVAEAAKQIPRSVRARYPEVRWKDLIGMGDMLRHQYFRVEADIVWDTVKVHFLVLLKVVNELPAADGVSAK